MAIVSFNSFKVVAVNNKDQKRTEFPKRFNSRPEAIDYFVNEISNEVRDNETDISELYNFHYEIVEIVEFRFDC